MKKKNNNTRKSKVYEGGGTLDIALTGANQFLNSLVNSADLGNRSADNIEIPNTYNKASTNESLLSNWSNMSNMEHVDWRNLKNGSTAQNLLSGVTGGGALGAAFGPIGLAVGAGAGLLGGVFGTVSANNRARRQARRLNAKIDEANDRQFRAFNANVGNVENINDLNIASNFSAYGGPLYFSNGGKIHIKKANKGKFTEYCGGKVTSECIAKGKRSSDPTIRKRATFAANARKWKHALGGYLYDNGGNLYTSIPNTGQHGADFSNDVVLIENGGTHEENPNNGVIMGMSQDGVPNLVEEGEVKFNDYVFSDRLKPNKKALEAMGLPKTYSKMSFADIAKKLSRESSERPNDPISERGLMNSMSKLQQMQESMREIEVPKGNILAEGGPTWLRYAPAVGTGISTLTDIFGLTNKPDYSRANMVGNAVNNLSEVDFTPVGNYLAYRPLDTDYYTNKLNSLAGATRRSIENQSGGNRSAAIAGLLAADYNAQGRLGDLARQAEEYNQAQRERVENFNRQTNMFNSEMGLKADTLNKQNDELRLKARLAQAQLMGQEDARASASRSANLTNFFNSLGNIGKEEFTKNMIMNNPALYYDMDNKGNVGYKKPNNKRSKGGYLTIK